MSDRDEDNPEGAPSVWPGAAPALQGLGFVLALAVAVLISASLVGQWSQRDFLSDYLGHEPSVVDTVLDWAASLDLGPAVMLVAALVLVAASGSALEVRGRRAMWLVVAVGLIVGGAQGASALDAVLRDDDPGNAFGAGVARTGDVGTVVPLAATALVAGLVAWCAFSLLEQDRIARLPTVTTDELGDDGSAVGEVDDHAGGALEGGDGEPSS